MRMLVCGSREWTDRVTLYNALTRVAGVLRVDEVIHGDANGADRMAGEWAKAWNIPVTTFPADWKGRGKRAGVERNEQMLEVGHPDLVVAFPLSGSIGTWHMVRIARAAGIKTWVMPHDLGAVDALGEGVFL